VLGRLLVEPRSTLTDLASVMKTPVHRVEPGHGREVGARLLAGYVKEFRLG
jgi:hypothetical protein